jgi:hypothetical protein
VVVLEKEKREIERPEDYMDSEGLRKRHGK